MGMGSEEGKYTLQHRPAQHETLCQAVALYSSHRDQLSTCYRRQCTTDQSAPQIKKHCKCKRGCKRSLSQGLLFGPKSTEEQSVGSGVISDCLLSP